jgi:hypothetical protein
VIRKVAVGHDVARVRNGHVTEKEHGFRIRRIQIVGRPNDVLYVRRRVRARDIATNNGPAVANEIFLETSEFTGKAAHHGVVYDEDDFPAIVDERTSIPV